MDSKARLSPEHAEAVRLLSWGLWPLAISPHGHKSKTHSSPGKAPLGGKQWGRERPTEKAIDQLFRRYPGAGVGLLLGPLGRVVDLDLDFEAETDREEADRFFKLLFGMSDIRTLAFESGRGPHFLFEWHPRLEHFPSVVKLGPLELRFGGPDLQLQSVVPPTATTIDHPDRTEPGPRREWACNGEPLQNYIARLPDGFFASLDRLLAEREQTRAPKAPKLTPKSDAALAADALESLGHLAVCYDDWLRIGLALAGLGDEGLAIWDAWSKTHCQQKYQEGVCSYKWRTFKPNQGLKLGTIFGLAKREGWRPRASSPTKPIAKAGLTAPAPSKNGSHNDPTFKPYFISIRADSLIPERTEWLWPERLPRGTFTLFSGPGGLGKSTALYSIAAAITRGGTLPGCAESLPLGHVLILTSEEHPTRGLAPKLVTAEADRSKITVLRQVVIDSDGTMAHAHLLRDLDALRDAIRRVDDPRLIIFDPITSYMGGIDDHKNVDVRSIIDPISELCEELNITAAGITHWRKGQGSAADRVIGSVAFRNAARVVYGFVQHPHDPTRTIMSLTKDNCGARKDSITFRVTKTEEGFPYLEWDAQVCELTADDALAMGFDSTAEDRAEARECEDWLRAGLEAADRGRLLKQDIVAAAREAGFSVSQIERAKSRLGLLTEREGFGGKCYWVLPERDSFF